jgi:hypothetical protein
MSGSITFIARFPNEALSKFYFVLPQVQARNVGQKKAKLEWFGFDFFENKLVLFWSCL